MNTWVAPTAFLVVLMRLTTATHAGGHSVGISLFPVSKHGPVGYHGPLAKPVVQKNGHLADTLEVAAARGEHLIAVAKAHSTPGYGSDDDYSSSDDGSFYDPGYEGALHGIYSHGPSTEDMYKGEYGYAGLQSFSTDDHSYGHGDSGAGFGGQDGGYGGESATHDSEIAGYGSQGGYSFAGQAGFGGQEGGYGGESAAHGKQIAGYGSQGGYSSGRNAGSAYHGPLAAPVLLKSGYLADIHDVAAAKGAHYVALPLGSQHGGQH